MEVKSGTPPRNNIIDWRYSISVASEGFSESNGFIIRGTYTSHKNNCLNSREMSVLAHYKSQKSIKSNSTTCENCELRIKKFRLLGIGSVIFRYYASIVLIYIVLYSLKPFFSKRLCIQLSKRR